MNLHYFCRLFLKLLSKELKDERSAARDDDSSTQAGQKNIKLTILNHK